MTAFELDIPGYKSLCLKNLVLDFNGTIAFDGQLIPGVADRLSKLRSVFAIYVISADTYGSVRAQMETIAEIKLLESTDHREEKRKFVRELGEDSVVAIGNGRIDTHMLSAASLGITVCQGEGASMETMMAGDILINDIRDALDLLIFPDRLRATLRS